MYAVFKSMDVKLYRFSTNQKHKNEFSRERAMGERWKCILCRKYFLIAIRKTNNWRSVSQELAVKQLSWAWERNGSWESEVTEAVTRGRVDLLNSA